MGKTEGRMGPLRSDHPEVGTVCPDCERPFEAGDYLTLVALRPADEDEAAKAAKGRCYTAVAAVVHWDCDSPRG